MKLLRVVLDSNIFISAIIKPGSNPARILDLALAGKIRLVLSDDILTEIKKVMQYPKIARLHGRSQQEIDYFIKRLRTVAHMVPNCLKIDVVPEDPDDNKVIACAVEGYADFIVSGDRHLTVLATYENIKIVSPKVFYDLIVLT